MVWVCLLVVLSVFGGLYVVNKPIFVRMLHYWKENVVLMIFLLLAFRAASDENIIKMSVSGISSRTIVWSHDKTHWNEKSPYDFRVHFVLEKCYKLTAIKREPCDDVNPVIVEYECDVIKHGFIMMMQWLGNTFRISSTCEGNPSVTAGWFHHMAINAELGYSLLLTW